ncbi:hypothetical protein [Prevotella sp. P2-180]|uniref:hypothetical protein n=1 Tax=Prevotella sp. P2-180 TaxID=2024224 RepID=UPI000BC7B51A|nr:hypothetical protein [Prevotella sp. P2-180]OYP66476.1 hypothetical protein CIK98_07535 [Prevotella sp. P2-180]
MSCFEIYYDGGAKKMRPINNFKEYAAIRNSTKNRRNTKLAREGNDEAKRKMVQFCYSCLPNDDGTLKGSKRMSNSVGMDIDFTKDMPKKEFEAAFEIMKDNILDKAQQLRLLMLERSATKGLHLVFERHPELTQEEDLEWAQKLLGVEFDKGAKDITRVFFTPTADPKDLFFCKDELFVNEECEVKEAEDEAKAEVKAVVPKTSAQGAGESPALLTGDKLDPLSAGEGTGERLYNGLPYSSIVTEFLRQFNNGQTPVEGNRNVMTFELAKALRSICDYNLDFMKEVIPRYDNFPEDEYVRTLQSAIDEPRRGVSYKLQKVLEVLYRKDKKTDGKVDFETENELPPAMPSRLPYPLGFLSSKVPEMYRPAVCEAVFAPLSTYVHSVKFRYWDGVEHEPTFMSVLTAPMSIGKGCVRKPISIILDELVKKDESNRAREAEWKQKNPASKQKRDPRPTDICVQVLIDNLTDAVFNQRVYDADKNGQRFLYTSVDELDTLKKITSRGTANEVSVIIRKAFDNSKHGQERVGADSVTGIAPLRFNFNASTTNRNFQQFFAREMTTGTVTRLSLATIIKPIGAKRPVFKEYDANYCAEVKKLTQKLSMLSGEISCPKCNKFAEQLCDENEQLASLYGSDPYLVLSYRATVIAWLKGMMLYVMNGEKWTKDIQDYMEWSLRYDLWVKMHVIGKMLDAAFDDEENATSKRGPMNMLTLLKDEFTMEDLILVRRKLGKSVDIKSVKAQLSLWRSRKFIDFDDYKTVIKKIKKNK